jgi:hypothetical protein
MQRRGHRLSISTSNGTTFEGSARRLGLNTLVVESDRHLRYGDEVTVRVGFVELPATVRWTTGDGFGAQVGSLRPQAIWGLHQMGLR